MRQLKIAPRLTNRDTPGLEKYLQDVSKMEMITPDEEVELAKRIQQGDMSAVDRLVTANLRFVVSVAKQYQNRGMSLQDLINEGNLGLLKAAKRFDASKGFKFISYAVWWIRQSIYQSLAENSRLVRLPVNKINTMSKINQATSKLEQEFEREPTPEEVAELIRISPEDVKISQENYARITSMDAPLNGEEEDGSLYDVTEDEEALSPEHTVMKESLNKEINRTLSTLTARESDVLKFYYGIGNQQPPLLADEIAKIMEISPERVRQIKDKAIRRLRHTSRSKLLKMYLG